MMLGFLLARKGVEVIVLEKHKDFLRDFRGDTIHPSTLELMYELGLLEEFLRQPHQEVRQVQVHFGTEKATIADFSHLPTHCKFIAFMPQWDFLNFISTHARHCASFRLRMEAEVTDLLFENERIVGVRATTPQGELEVRADLVVGADGRSFDGARTRILGSDSSARQLMCCSSVCPNARAIQRPRTRLFSPSSGQPVPPDATTFLHRGAHCSLPILAGMDRSGQGRRAHQLGTEVVGSDATVCRWERQCELPRRRRR